MSPKTLLSALLCATACLVVQAAEVTTFDLGQVDTSYFSATGSGQTVRLLNGDTVPNATYEYSSYELGSQKTKVEVRHLVIGADLTLTGSATAFGLKAGADITLTLDGVTVEPSGHYTAGVGGLNVHTLYTDNHTVTLRLTDGTENTFTGSYSISSSANHSCHAGITVPAGGTLIIEGGTGELKAACTSKGGASGIGHGLYDGLGFGNVTINGGVITAIGCQGAGIGSGWLAQTAAAGTIAIHGGTVTASSSYGAAAIGGGESARTPKIVIDGTAVVTATISAEGVPGAAAIGAGANENANCSTYNAPDITIGGTAQVTAIASDKGVAIGGSAGTKGSTDGGTIKIADTATVVAQAGTGAAYAIGPGNGVEASTSTCTLEVAETASVDTRGGNTPMGILGAVIIDLANKSATPSEAVEVSGDSVTVKTTDKAVILKGANADVTVALPDGAELVFPEGDDYGANLKAITCAGSFKVEGNNSLTVGSFTGTMTLAQRSGTSGMTLTVNDACDGTVAIVGRNVVTLPEVKNVASYTPLASVTTTKAEEAGKFPKTLTAEAFDLADLTANSVLPENWSVTVVDDEVARLSIPSGTVLKGVATNLTVAAAGDVTLSDVTIKPTEGYSALVLPASSVTVTLTGANTLTANDTAAALKVPSGGGLTLTGTGSLDARAMQGAAIGGDAGESSGAMTFAGTGTVLAVSNSGAAIGGGRLAGASGTIKVTDGTVVAIGLNGAGIGTGWHSAGTGADIQLLGGKILAYSSAGAAIGTGSQGKVVPTITMSGSPAIVATTNVKPEQATVTAKMGVDETTAEAWLALMTLTNDAAGAAIGGGQNACFGTITIEGGDIVAASDSGSAIGGGANYANVSNAETAATDSISISGAGTNIVASSTSAAAIGAGSATTFGITIGSITIDSEASVTATTNGATASAIGGTGKTGVSTITIGSDAGGNKVLADTVGNGTASTTESVITIHLSDTAVARIGTVGYDTFAAAVEAAVSGDTVDLVADCAIEDDVTLPQVITLRGNGKTLSTPANYSLVSSEWDAEVTLDGVSLVSASTAHFQPLYISGTCALTLKGSNAITGGICVYGSTTVLTIQGDGDLVVDASGNKWAAAIGGYYYYAPGDIILQGTGTITALGGYAAAAIGGGGYINTGYALYTRGGTISIASGTVIAKAKDYGASIGAGFCIGVTAVNITGGTVTAEQQGWAAVGERFNNSNSALGAGIGTYGGRSTAAVDEMTISITGAATKVIAKGSPNGCGIGGAYRASVESIYISDAEVTAIGQSSVAAIGSGNYGLGSGEIIINGAAEVIAEAVGLTVYSGADNTTDVSGYLADGAAIGGGYANRANVTIGGSAKVLAVNAGPGTYAYWGGTYTAVSPTLCNSPTGAAIGSGRIPCYPAYTSVAAGAYPDQVVITGSAQVWAYGGQGGAGIGGGHDSWAQNGIQYGTPMNFPNITLSGTAQVVAVGGTGASAIGGGHHAQHGGQIVVASTATITATAGAAAAGGTVPAAIGNGSYDPAGTYCPSQGNSGAATVAAEQPTTTLTVEAEGAVSDLAIVTKDNAGNATNLSDSPGLAINLKQGETVQSVTQTAGSETGNAIVAEATQANPVSTATDAEAGTVTHTLALDGAKALANAQTEAGSAYLAAANGDVVARLDTVETELGGTKTTLAVLDPALVLNGSAALVTQDQSKEDRADVAEKAWLLNAALAFSADEASSAALTYAYEFGIEAITAGNVTAEGIPLTSVTIGLKEGSGAAATARSGRLNGTLNLYANGEKVAAYALKSPTFTNGQCTIVPAQAPCLPLATGEQAIKLTVKLEP
ncbi:MAG: beta strand repeat-containing protein [Candidatus Spyradenecus sp.]